MTAVDHHGAYPSIGRSSAILVLLIFATLVAYIDRQLLALLLGPIKQSFALSDTKLGILQGVALNLCFGLASLPMGALVDRTNRCRLIGISVASWTLFTIATAFTGAFWQLFICRMGIGLSEAGLVPAAYSLIADLYSERNRTNGVLVFYCAIYIGASAAIAIGGVMIGELAALRPSLPLGLSQFEVWRLAFIGAGIPGLLLTVPFILLRDPPRQGSIGRTPHAGALTLGAYLRENGATMARVCGGLVAASVGVDALLMWMPAILTRAFSLSESRSGEVFGLLLCAGSLTGAGLAGLLAAHLRRRSALLAPLQVLRLGAVASAVVLPLMAVGHGLSSLLALALIYMTLAYAATAVGPTLLATIAPNHLRGRVYSIWVAVTVIAACLWPGAIGKLSDTWFPGPFGLLHAMLWVATPAALLAVALLGSVSRAYRQTVESVGAGEASPPPDRLVGSRDSALAS